MTTPTAVIVLAAGAGTRMKSSLPKVVHPVVGRSMIGHALHAAAGTHPDHLVAVVRHQRELVAAEILRNNPDVIIADQDDIPEPVVRCNVHSTNFCAAVIVFRARSW